MASQLRSDLDPTQIPDAVRALLRTLTDAGHETLLVGGCVRDLLRGAPVRDFDAVTRAPVEAVLGLFPRAVPIGVRHGTVMIPTAVGPVDVTSMRAGPDFENDLAYRDFSVNAMAYDPMGGGLLDPFDGRGDLVRGRLRAVRSAQDRFREDPLRTLRAARLQATLGLEPDAELRSAMAAWAPQLGGVAAERLRAELQELLGGSQAGAGLRLMRECGLEAVLAPGAAADAPAVVDALPPHLELRLAAWLRGARALSILVRLRFSRRRAERVERMLRLHPIEAGADLSRDASLRRLLRRAGDDWDELVALRRAELSIREGSAEAAQRLSALEAAAARLRRAGRLALRRGDLALDGRAVMQRLDCGPGRAVGEALAFLTERVLDDPACNTPERLGSLLEQWWAEREGGPR